MHNVVANTSVATEFSHDHLFPWTSVLTCKVSCTLVVNCSISSTQGRPDLPSSISRVGRVNVHEFTTVYRLAVDLEVFESWASCTFQKASFTPIDSRPIGFLSFCRAIWIQDSTPHGSIQDLKTCLENAQLTTSWTHSSRVCHYFIDYILRQHPKIRKPYPLYFKNLVHKLF